MSAPVKRRPWRRDPRVSNPYRDTLRQEIGYRVDARTAGCLLISFAFGLLIMAGLAFLTYWLARGI